MSIPQKASRRVFARNINKCNDNAKKVSLNMKKDLKNTHSESKFCTTNRDAFRMLKNISMSQMTRPFSLLSEKAGLFTNSEERNYETKPNRDQPRENGQTPKLYVLWINLFTTLTFFLGILR